jgi:hypothetical protein
VIVVPKIWVGRLKLELVAGRLVPALVVPVIVIAGVIDKRNLMAHGSNYIGSLSKTLRLNFGLCFFFFHPKHPYEGQHPQGVSERPLNDPDCLVECVAGSKSGAAVRRRV